MREGEKEEKGEGEGRAGGGAGEESLKRTWSHGVSNLLSRPEKS